MEKSEAKVIAKSLYLQSAALAGLEVSEYSPEGIALIVDRGFDLVEEKHRPTAAANTLRLIAVALEMAEARGDYKLHENSADEASEKICPIYPFGKGR